SGRSLTTLTQLTGDTSWCTQYRSRKNNPALDPSFTFPQAAPGLAAGKFPAIPVTDADLSPDDHIQAIANTRGIPFCLYRARRYESVSRVGPAGDKSRGSENLAQHWPNRNCSLSDMA